MGELIRRAGDEALERIFGIKAYRFDFKCERNRLGCNIVATVFVVSISIAVKVYSHEMAGDFADGVGKNGSTPTIEVGNLV